MKNIKENFLEGLEHSFFGQLRKVLVASHRISSKLIAETKLPLQVDQLPVFMAIYIHDQISQQEIANNICRDKASVKRTISHLEKNGLVKIQPHPTDKRANLISLTEEGNKAVLLINDVIEEVNKTIKEAAATDVDLLTNALKSLGEKLASLPGLDDIHCQHIQNS
ncbi:MarR family winged helix-turn-helix transcriptional regulator [Taibaiella sp. KBW10]|uniref:MarR family winged helix-turn-helix transcriptional regulator n=1 Tax=Taibaiella sp. KBW10 TaxID=2153357 RepID=UPI000F5A7A66|nr:MarR family transcriptional regulator [Taibaiella sp. KBW10]